MNEESAIGSFGFLLFVGVVWLGITVYNQNKTIAQLKDVIQTCSDTIDLANSHIDDLNNQNSNAQEQAWTDYDTMGSTLESLGAGDENDNVDGSDCIVPTN